MQGNLFVFIGLPNENSNASLSVLIERLENKFDKNEIIVRFNRKGELLLARLDEVSFYISLLKNKDELKDWYQMAIDFELNLDKKPINKKGLLSRYDKLKDSLPIAYKEIHYATALCVIEEMEKFSNLTIYSFQ